MSTKINYMGKEYKSVSALARSYNMESSVVISRLNIGWSMEDALGLTSEKSNRIKRTQIEYGGESYDSVADLAEAYSLKPMTLYKRLNRGKSLSKALCSCVKREKFKGVYNNKEYTSLRALSKDTGVNTKTIKSRLNSGCSLEEAVVQGNSIIYQFPIEIDGVVYTCLKQLAKAYNLKNGTICDRVARGLSLKDSLFPVDANSGIKTVYKDIEYKSILELAEAYNINDRTLRARLSNGWSLDKALTQKV